MINSKNVFRLILVAVLAVAAYRILTSDRGQQVVHLSGQTMGTIVYNVKYLGSEDIVNYQREIDSILVAFNQSLSTYVSDSEISRLNRSGRLDSPSPVFLDVARRSAAIHAVTKGAFDPSVGPLVNAWGFGPDKAMSIPDSIQIDSLIANVGYSRVQVWDSLILIDKGMYIDYSSIAKGYAVDLVADFLMKMGHANVFVEIGGEVVAHGVNAKGEPWKVGIEDPMVGRDERRLLAILELSQGMATSGNYRNYYQLGDRTIAHTIDPRTGYNTFHRLLSVTVVAADCMTADAYATAFMVVGVDEAKGIAQEQGLQIFLVYQDEQGEIKTYASEGLKEKLEVDG